MSELQQQVDALPWYHVMELPGGVVTPGVDDPRDRLPLLSLPERVDLVEAEMKALHNTGNGNGTRIEVRSFDNLLINFAQAMGATVIVRGLRAVTDFEYEFQMAGMNTRLNPKIETVFLMASERYQFISSRFVKEICRLDGDISQFVSPAVESRVKARYARG